jgi:DNA-binding MarR family transcriptional regulator
MVSVHTEEEMRQEVIERFWETIPPVWNLVRNNLRSIAVQNFEISVEQFHILRHIRKGITSASELAEIRQISRPAISQAVDLLVEKGLISRQQDADDRRYIHLALTPNGDDLLNQIFKANRAWMSEKFASLSPDEMSQINDALAILKTALEDSVPASIDQTIQKPKDKI